EHSKGSLALSLDTSDALAQYAATSLTLLNRIETIEEITKKLEAVTAQDVQRVAKDIFKTERLKLAVIGPHEDASKLKALLRV
ncbi:insulinase family protein, partial [Acetobacteraceae bacterium]|nr:insulinase family protein [Candidatus Parcubacteria bacterium]